MSSASGPRQYGRFDKLAEEFAERYRQGEQPSVHEYVESLPEMAEEIRAAFPALVEGKKAKGDFYGDASPRPPPASPRRRHVGDYRILREVGRGGMGMVYEAEQVSLGRRVALKVLPRHVVGDRTALERFRREAKAAAGLHHTNIVPVFEVGQDGDIAFFAMQFIQGQGLDQVIGELRRLRDPDRKPFGEGCCGRENLAKIATAPLDAGASSAALGGYQLGRVAEPLLTGGLATGGLATGGLQSRARGAAAIGHQATEKFDPDATERFDHEATPGPLPRETGPDLFGALPAPVVSSCAVLPGGKHVSEVDISGHRQPFFRSVAQIGRQVAQALAYAHARGIIHRDIKPSNLMLDTEGITWVTDFGLAKNENDGLTATGDVLGTLHYMAPCRFRGEGDARADIYALGLTLYELVTLRSAYETTDRLKLIEQINSEEPARPRSIDGQIPRDLETIILRAIAKEPDRRYQSAEEMGEDLRRFLADEAIEARRYNMAERYARWARHHPTIAVVGGVLTAVLVLVTIGSLLAAGRFARLADAERSARHGVSRQATAESCARAEADLARSGAEKARASALAETYRAMLSEIRALRAGHQPGRRVETLANLWMACKEARALLKPDAAPASPAEPDRH